MTQLSSPPHAREVAVEVECHAPVLVLGLDRTAERNASAGEAR